MQLTIVGPGRAGMSLALAARAAGHSISAVVGRNPAVVGTSAVRLDTTPFDLGEDLPTSDLLVIAVRDDVIASVAGLLSSADAGATAAVHMSGLAPVDALDSLQSKGIRVGSFHPLQTLPTPEAGAAALAGSWIAVTAPDAHLAELLERLAESLDARPFRLDDTNKAVYHAAASASANFSLAALTMAADLFAAAGVPFEASRPLVEAVVANAYQLGPRAALTGPVARGDVATVDQQLAAVIDADPSLAPAFAAFVGELARLTGRGEAFEAVIASAQRGS
jgi:predicted short-subunit dehydrogenase-like oxidoreductase (DUF2520 family)